MQEIKSFCSSLSHQIHNQVLRWKIHLEIRGATLREAVNLKKKIK